MKFKKLIAGLCICAVGVVQVSSARADNWETVGPLGTLGPVAAFTYQPECDYRFVVRSEDPQTYHSELRPSEIQCFNSGCSSVFLTTSLTHEGCTGMVSLVLSEEEQNLFYAAFNSGAFPVECSLFFARDGFPVYNPRVGIRYRLANSMGDTVLTSSPVQQGGDLNALVLEKRCPADRSTAAEKRKVRQHSRRR